jgi:hypothetical protein
MPPLPPAFLAFLMQIMPSWYVLEPLSIWLLTSLSNCYGALDLYLFSPDLSLPRIHELDWWDERLLRVALPANTDGPPGQCRSPAVLHAFAACLKSLCF